MIYCNPNNDEEIQLMTPNNNNLTWTDTTTTDTWDTSLLRMGYTPYYYWDTLPTTNGIRSLLQMGYAPYDEWDTFPNENRRISVRWLAVVYIVTL